MPKSNLESPTSITAACDLSKLDAWFASELDAIASPAVRSVMLTVCANLSEFVEFPSRAILLWHGCDRIAPREERQKLHKYPDELRQLAKEQGVRLDSRPNGPAIASFLIAGGRRPNRIGSNNAWSIHHLYSGKFPYLGRESTIHAPRDGLHFTQSAGLVAAQPIADALCDELPCFAWLLRAEAFRRFGYDPDGAFTDRHDGLGITGGTSCEIAWREQ